MFIHPQTYLDAIFLLLGDNSDRSRGLVKEFIETVERQEGMKQITTADDELIGVYKSLIKSVSADRVSQEDQTAAKMLLLRIRSNEVFQSYPLQRDLLTDVLTAEEPISAHQIDRYIKRLRNILVSAELDKTTRRLMAQSRTISEIQDVDEQANEIAKMQVQVNTTMKSIESRLKTSDTKASESYVSLSDPESINRSLTTYMERSVTGVVVSGLQGLNRAMGGRGGAGRGETIVFAASSHNFKSGMLVKWLIWCAVYNKFVVQPGKKALIYFISLENEVHQNLMDVFKTLYCQTEHRKIDLETMSVEFITQWVTDYFSQFDVLVIVDRYTPHEFHFQKFSARYNSFVEQNYEMVAFILDYMSEARGVAPGDTISGQGRIQMINENYTLFANHAKQCGYLLATGHQLIKKAEEIASNFRYAVKKFNASLMADSSDVYRIVDMLFFLQLETNVDGNKFLTCQNRKNRGSSDTPEKDKFFAYPFTEFGIEDDYNGLPQYVQDIDDVGVSNRGAKDDAIVDAAMF